MDYLPMLSRLDVMVDPRSVVPPADWEPFANGLRCAGGDPFAVLSPESVDELRAVVRACVDAGLPVVPQGANSGLVGAAVPDGSGRQAVLFTRRPAAARPLAIAAERPAREAGLRVAQPQAALGTRTQRRC